MANTKAIIGHGLLFKRGNSDGPPETFTTLVEMIDIDAPEVKLATEDASNQDSPNFAEEFIAGLVQHGEAKGTFNFVEPGAYATLKADVEGRLARNWQILPPASAGTSKKLQFSAFVTGVALNWQNKSKVMATVTFKVNSGLTTWA